MSDKSDSPSSRTTLQRIAQTFRLTGWIGFWIQLVLGVVSAVVLLLFVVFSQTPGVQKDSPGTGIGIFFAVCGLVTLAGSIYFAFRYTRIAKQLQSANPSNRPGRSQTVQVLRLGLNVNLVGMLLTLLGAQAIVGSLVARAISQAQGAVFNPYQQQQLISALDMFVIQANTNTVAAHFAGIVCSLWLINRVTR